MFFVCVAFILYFCSKCKVIAYMKKLISILVLTLFFSVLSFSQNKYRVDYSLLEEALSNREVYVKLKEASIDSLRKQLDSDISDKEKLFLYNKIYEEYYTFSFDSAMYYVDKLGELSEALNNFHYQSLSKIYKSYLLTTSGYFSESINNLKTIDHSNFPDSLLVEYYITYEWAYRQWAEYSNDTIYAPQYKRMELLYQDSIISVLPEGSREFYFWNGERSYRKNEYLKAEEYYNRVMKLCSMNERIYAMTTFGLAMVNAKLDRWNRYEYFMMNAAISDQICPLKENLALQELALYIYKSNEKEASRANRYLTYSMEDAIFYGNRLRLLEISHKLPDIITTYDRQKAESVRMQYIYMIGVALLLVVTLLLMAYIYRQMLLIRDSRRNIISINTQLNEQNKKLLNINNLHEEYVSLFINLCAAYINKHARFQTLVIRKIKSNQTEDLLKMLNSSRLSEADTREFFINFDNSFVKLYPEFIERFNQLLCPGKEIKLKKGEILNTELRIYALMRLGVTDSAQIANLLFYSTQTIYNYRSAVKSRAVNPESFENDVKRLCCTA